MFRSTTILMAALLLLTTACNRRPEGVVSDKEMTDLIVDMHIADAYAYRQGVRTGDALLDSLHRQVLKDHGVSEKDYQASLQWYGRNMDVYSKLYEKVERVLDKKQGLLVPDETAAEVHTSLWPTSPMAMISPLSPSRDVRFSFLPEDLDKGDRLIWTMRLQKEMRAQVLLGVDYTDGSSTYVTRSSETGRRLKMTIQTDTALTVERVYGYVMADRAEPLPLWVDSITLTREPYIPDEYSIIQTQTQYLLPEVRRARYLREKERRDSIAREKAIVPAGIGTATPSNPMIPRHTGYPTR